MQTSEYPELLDDMNKVRTHDISHCYCLAHSSILTQYLSLPLSIPHSSIWFDWSQCELDAPIAQYPPSQKALHSSCKRANMYLLLGHKHKM